MIAAVRLHLMKKKNHKRYHDAHVEFDGTQGVTFSPKTYVGNHADIFLILIQLGYTPLSNAVNYDDDKTTAAASRGKKLQY